ncbi:MAG: NAD-dependent epimerase/dehydratase family protein [Phycisphaerae bacterium]
MDVLVTGSSGLIGSEAVVFYDRRGARVWGIDNNMRAEFFGPQGDTSWNLRWLRENTRRFEHLALDIRDRAGILQLFKRQRFDLVIHCAAQPSHDLAARRPFEDFDVNAVGTLNLLEATRQHCPEAVFVHMSTNKVYGDAPNELELVELPTRYDYARPEDRDGIDETCRLDRSLHSLFGASKAASDIMAQEYGRYFGMPVGIFRGGCLTGVRHSGVELHGFLSYIVKAAVRGSEYTIFGYKGKQVRDQIDSYDVLSAIDQFFRQPRPAEVYNIGGGRDNSISILETIDRLEELTGRRLQYSYREQARRGDHICYISNLKKLRSHFPEWRITRSLDAILEQMVRAERAREFGA